ncbi:hypothetical protein PybrP1_007575 [[Pythium] brassicae (nom. inval.)]|nr:hypothetical protein PybrP1_007575 [[Pythium] brassicae (nom. inval.)]
MGDRNLLGNEDSAVFSADDMVRFGAERGWKLLLALYNAAARGVTLRVLTAKESVSGGSGGRLPDELQLLVDAFPERVLVRCWSGDDWYGGGILHQKIWLFDQRDVYIGSANMDWKSLAQVMEVGVLLEGLAPSSPLLLDVQKLFDTWWAWASPELAVQTATYVSERFQSALQVPSWSLYLPKDQRTADPFVAAHLEANGNITHQMRVAFASSATPSTRTPAAPANVFFAAAPLEATAAHSRAFDEDALVYTIRSAKARVSLSVMDFAPFSIYKLASHAGPVYWSALTDALLEGVYAKKGLRVRVLVSEWQHSHPQIAPALALLQAQADLCTRMRGACSGRLEIRRFRVPGWANTTSSTAAARAAWPAYTRVNHAKFIVTDARANVGTSNMEWGYFYTTAGASVNTDHEPTRAALEALFDRNWDSIYAAPLEKR